MTRYYALGLGIQVRIRIGMLGMRLLHGKDKRTVSSLLLLPAIVDGNANGYLEHDDADDDGDVDADRQSSVSVVGV